MCISQVMAGLQGLGIAAAGDHNFDDPARTNPGLGDLLWDFSSAHRPADGATLAERMIGGHKGDLMLAQELAVDWAVKHRLIGLDRQTEVDTLVLALPKDGFWVNRAPAWISTPSGNRSPSSCLSWTRFWFSPEASQAWLHPADFRISGPFSKRSSTPCSELRNRG